MTPMPLAIATIEAPRIDEGLREQGVEPLVVEWFSGLPVAPEVEILETDGFAAIGAAVLLS